MQVAVLNERKRWEEDDILRDDSTRAVLFISGTCIEAEKSLRHVECEETVATNDNGGEKALDANFDDTKTTKICGIKINKTLQRTLLYVLAYVFLLVVGGAIFSAVEHPHEVREHNEFLKEYDAEVEVIINILNNHNYTGVEADTRELHKKLMQYSTGFHPRPDDPPLDWDFRNAVTFTFTIITTIGYGNISPGTVWGKIFVILYALVGIPVAGMSLIFFAERALYIFTWLSKIGSDKVEEAFRHFDEDGSGQLEEEEFKEAVKMLGFDLSPAQFSKFWNQIDSDDGGTIELDEFREAIDLMNADVTETAGQKNKVYITLAAFVIWLVLGVVVFKFVEEEWGWLDSLYFVIVSLTTVGLGDFVPDTLPGQVFLVSFAIVGLGLVAIFIALIQVLISELGDQKQKNKLKQKGLKQNEKLLKQIPIFASMAEGDLKSILENITIMEFGRNKNILKEGSEMDSHYYVLTRGTVSVSTEGSDDKQIISAPLFLSQSSVVNNPRTSLADATYSADENVEILSVNREDWERIFPVARKEILANVAVKDMSLGSSMKV